MTAAARRALLLAALPLGAAAQPASSPVMRRPAVIGVLGINADDADGPTWQAFVAELRRRGRVEGSDYTLLRRYAAPGQADRLPALAAELVAAQVDLIYAVQGSPSALAAARASSTIPVVFFSSADPVGLGLVRSLARPGGNVTGAMPLGYETSIKGFELMVETLGRIRQLLFFVPAADRRLPGNAGFEPLLRAAAAGRGTRLDVVESASAADLIAGLPALKRDGADAAMVFDFPVYRRSYDRIAQACIEHRLPAFGYVHAGFLMHVSQDRHELARIAARLVDRIIGGAVPGELPVEQLSGQELSLNLRTARALGLRIPASVLARASEVVE